ncbi:MAG: type IV pilus assembly protein PilM [Actinomycetota bacterium]|nr:type IV pilus assembly protein PilM [Actinomycetota bacterium]
MTKARNQRRSVVGLDIEPSFLAAAEVRANGAIAVERAATAPLEPGVMRDGEVTDVDALAEALKPFFHDNNLGRRVRLGVANQRIVVRTIDVPSLSDPKELAAAVRFQAQEHIPMPLDLAVLDFQTLGSVQTEQGERTRVMLVAARRDMVDRLLEAVRRAGLRPEGVDLSAFAMIRALDNTPQARAEDGENEGPARSVLYVSVGGLTNLAIAERAVCRFTRVAAGGLEGMVGQLAERRGLTLEHSRQWLTHVGLSAPIEQLEGDAEIVTEARTVLSDGVRRIADDVRNSIDYYRAQEAAVTVEEAVLTGAAVSVPGFTQQLSADLGIPVTAGVVAEAHDGAVPAGEAGRLTVAAGLAVEERHA